jgi:hypothetical protein
MPVNLVTKRQNLAARMVLQAQALDAALDALLGLAAERANLTEDFQDSDFATALPVVILGVPVRIDHLDSYSAGAILDFGFQPLHTAYTTGTPTPQAVILKARQ